MMESLEKWRAKSVKWQKARQEKATKEIIAETSANELKIRELLSGIDFFNSKLPRETLEYRSKEGQRYGDLEMTARLLVWILRMNPITTGVDIRSFDQKLYDLANLYKVSVEQGDERAAFAAKGALSRGINEIRVRIPTLPMDQMDQFIDLYARYLDQWISMVRYAALIDLTERGLKSQEADCEERKDAYHSDAREFLERMQADFAFLEAFQSLENTTTFDDWDTWSDVKKECFNLLLYHSFRSTVIEANELLLKKNQDNFRLLSTHYEIWLSKLLSICIPFDPIQINLFSCDLNAIAEDYAKQIHEFDENSTGLKDLDSKLEQLNNALKQKGTLLEAVESAQTMLKEMQELQEAEFQKGRMSQGADLHDPEEQTDNQPLAPEPQEPDELSQLYTTEAQRAEEERVRNMKPEELISDLLSLADLTSDSPDDDYA